MEEDDNLLQLDDSFFDPLPDEGHSLVDSAHAIALLEEADVEGEAAEAIRSHHHSFQASFNKLPQLNNSSFHAKKYAQEILIGSNDLLDDNHEPDEDIEENRSAKKHKPDPSDSTQLIIDNDVVVQNSSNFQEDRQGNINEEQNNRINEVEIDDSFHFSPDPNLRSFEKDNSLAAEDLSKKINQSDLLGIELEIDEDFLAPEVELIPIAPIQKPSKHPSLFDDAAPSFDEMLNEAENYEEEDHLEFNPRSNHFQTRPATIARQGSLTSFDELMNEAEGHQQDELFRLDSPFFDDSLNIRPTSAQQPFDVAAPSSPGALPISLAANTNTFISNTQSRWITDTSMQATTLDGLKIRVPRRKKKDITHPSRSKPNEELQKRCLDILDEPIHRMLAKAREDISRKDILSSTVMTLPKKCSNDKPRSLWTDRYRPTKFIDLIGDERVFRSAMGWLKTWDKCVFKKTESSHKRKRMLKALHQLNNLNSQSNSSAEVEIDPYGRPKEKVLLLAGKPGLGKTTMAQVLANQAGYQVIEINASDDRSSKTVTDHIKTALETRTLDGGAKNGGGLSLKDNRPTCVVIDEIDGATGGGGGNDAGFVKALVQLVTEGSSNLTPRISKKGKKFDKRPLLRPIICICNDLYAPVLRPLRPISRIIRFSSPTPTTIVKRLQSICKSENIVADLNNLNYLVRLSRCDLRSCLNTLQFISDQENTQVLNDQIIKSAVDSGIKDSASSVQTVLSRLFKIPVRSSSKSDTSGSKDFYLNDLVRDISTCGQNERIVQGCFESYLNMKQPTDLWRSYSRLFDWLEFYDRLETRIWTDQAYQLLSYAPYSIAVWREIFGSLNNNKTPLEYPKIDYENYSRRLINEETMATFKQIIPPTISSCFKSQEIVCELLPFLIRSISVDLRPVNSKLIKKEEKEVLMRVVQIMLHLGLKLVQDKSEDGQLSYTLEPAIDFSVNYGGSRPPDIPPPRYSVRQMIVNEMNSFSFRGQSDAATAGPNGNLDPTSALSILDAYKRKPNPKSNSNGKNEKVKLDFFGRKEILGKIDALATTSSLAGGESTSKKEIRVLYRYHEGFSNAVKKPITLNELLSK